jgi:electron transfer flavoprotein alpha subunit
MKMNNDIYVYIEHNNVTIREVSLELISKAQELKASRPNLDINIVGVLIGSSIELLVTKVIHYGADKVITYENKDLETYNTSNYSKVISEIIIENDPEAFLIGGTLLGRDLAPRISAKVKTGLTADATSIEFNPEDETSKELWITRPAFGGNLFATIVCPKHRPQMATIRENVFTKNMIDTTKGGIITSFDYDLIPNHDIRVLKKITKQTVRNDITKARIIVSGGRGVSKDIWRISCFKSFS